MARCKCGNPPRDKNWQLDGCEELRETKDMLLSLLAIIHRDGGHYAVKHGLRKATDDAMKLHTDLLLESGV